MQRRSEGLVGSLVGGADTGPTCGSVQKTVFQTISDMLERQGIHCTGRQCRDKIKLLKKKYKEIVDKLHRSRVGVNFDEELEVWDDWKWFEPLHRLMRKRPSVNPVGLLQHCNHQSGRFQYSSCCEKEEEADDNEKSTTRCECYI